MSVYKVIGTDPLGRSIERTGYDLNELIEEAKSAAGTVANAQ
ncbi:hypothetical protein [Rhizobium herbae]|uniref:Uncharacterized protein n=1 Tax=Rhizobium herbae TaxID=508661 RepID=A0ABS4EPE4_9HYPH|nr:hypothetical protein [Rhizobium herbae]MBP1859813.1 hypothetical protein [Rhizobium herbae]